MSNRDWREWAYTDADNWPEAIPWMGPKRENGPYPWHEPNHKDDHDLDDYPFSHADAASVGASYAGDVCPYCGVPLRLDESVVNLRGECGKLYEVSPDDAPVASYHEQCWKARNAKINSLENTSLTEWSE